MSLAAVLLDVLTSTPTPSPSPSPSPGGGEGTTTTTTSWVQYATLVAAGLAALVGLVAAVLQRRSGRESAEAARQSAAAAKTSSEASQRSAKAAEDSVALNAQTSRVTAARLHAEALSQRYQDAAAQLGHTSAAVRLAGMYAMARLADDWIDQRQTCVDVLCAYLRTAWSYPDGDDDGPGWDEREVRKTALSVLAKHLHQSSSPNWCDLDLDLTNAVLPSFKFENATFKKVPSFEGARFVEAASLSNASFRQGANFRNTVVNWTLTMKGLNLASGRIDLSRMRVNSDSLLEVQTNFVAHGASVWAPGLRCIGNVLTTFNAASQEQGQFRLTDAMFGELATIEIDDDIEIGPEDPALYKVHLRLARWAVVDPNRFVFPPEISAENLFTIRPARGDGDPLPAPVR